MADRSQASSAALLAWLLGGALLLASGCAGRSEYPRFERQPGRVRVGFYSPAALSTEQLAAVERLIRSERPDLVARCNGLPAASKPAGSLVEWRSVPGGRSDAALIAGAPGAPMHSIEVGALHLTVLETPEPLKSDSVEYGQLLGTLSATRKLWKIVLMPRPVFSDRVDRDLLDLADLFGRSGVALALSGSDRKRGAQALPYMRTAPIGPGEESGVRHVAMPLVPPKPLEQAVAPPWMASALTTECFCILDVTSARLTWSAYGVDGRLVDTFSIAADPTRRDAARFFTVGEILAYESDAQDKTKDEGR